MITVDGARKINEEVELDYLHKQIESAALEGCRFTHFTRLSANAELRLKQMNYKITTIPDTGITIVSWAVEDK